MSQHPASHKILKADTNDESEQAVFAEAVSAPVPPLGVPVVVRQPERDEAGKNTAQALAAKDQLLECNRLRNAANGYGSRMKPKTKTTPRGTQSPAVPTKRGLMTMLDAAQEAGVSRRFLEQEVGRGRLVITRLSNRIVRIRPTDWDAYLNSGLSAKRA